MIVMWDAETLFATKMKTQVFQSRGSLHTQPLVAASVSYFPQVQMFVTLSHQSSFWHQTGRNDEENSYNNDFTVIVVLLIPYGFTDLNFSIFFTVCNWYLASS